MSMSMSPFSFEETEQEPQEWQEPQQPQSLPQEDPAPTPLLDKTTLQQENAKEKKEDRFYFQVDDPHVSDSTVAAVPVPEPEEHQEKEEEQHKNDDNVIDVVVKMTLQLDDLLMDDVALEGNRNNSNSNSNNRNHNENDHHIHNQQQHQHQHQHQKEGCWVSASSFSFDDNESQSRVSQRSKTSTSTSTISNNSRLLQPTASTTMAMAKNTTTTNISTNKATGGNSHQDLLLSRQHAKQRYVNQKNNKNGTDSSLLNSTQQRKNKLHMSPEEGQARAKARVYLYQKLEQICQEPNRKENAVNHATQKVFPQRPQSTRPLTKPVAPKFHTSNRRNTTSDAKLQTQVQEQARDDDTASVKSNSTSLAGGTASASASASANIVHREYGRNFTPTVPIAPKFHMSARSLKKEQLQQQQQQQQQAEAAAKKAAALSSQSTLGPRKLTVPVGPKFLLDQKYGEKTASMAAPAATRQTSDADNVAPTSASRCDHHHRSLDSHSHSPLSTQSTASVSSFSQQSQSRGPRPLTKPVGPNLSLNRKYGEKIASH